jgi:uncharacterized protein
MKRFVSLMAAAAIALTLQAGAAFAQNQVSDSHLEVAREVLAGSGVARNFDAVVPGIQEAMRRQLVTQPAVAGAITEVLEELKPEMELQRRSMVTRAARALAGQLTEEELTEIAAFFNTPSGKRYVETQPIVLQETLRAMDEWTDEVAEYMQIRVRAEMQKRGHQMN